MNYIERKWQTKEGYTAYVINVNGHNNGYVEIGREHPAYGMNYYFGYVDIEELNINKIPLMKAINSVEVHGGLTFANGSIHELVEDKDIWVFGFDTNHVDDIRNPKSVDYVASDCESLSRQLKEMEENKWK